MKRILIAGVGNVLLGDDGVGPFVVAQLAARYEFDERVSVEDLGTPGLDLVVHLSDCDAVIIIDSVDNKQAAGTVSVFNRAALVKHAPPVRIDPHSPALTESLMIVELGGSGPKESVLVGVTGSDFSIGKGLSDEVRGAVDAAIEAVLCQLDEWGVRYKAKASSAPVPVWWEAPADRCLPIN